MVISKELQSRVRDFFSFSKQEITGLVVAVLITSFIFSSINGSRIIIDLNKFIGLLIITSFSFFFRVSIQKIYALSQGYKTEFKIWWTGILISLVVAFVSFGKIPLILIGASVSSFMIKQRLGEFRYGFSHSDNATIALWGVLGSLVIATLFAVGLKLFPQSYFSSKGVILNIIMALCALIPLPQLEGLQIYFGSRLQYAVGLISTLLVGLLLLTKTKIGLIITIILGATIAILFLLKSGE